MNGFCGPLRSGSLRSPTLRGPQKCKRCADNVCKRCLDTFQAAALPKLKHRQQQGNDFVKRMESVVIVRPHLARLRFVTLEQCCLFSREVLV